MLAIWLRQATSKLPIPGLTPGVITPSRECGDSAMRVLLRK
jgi:hypothetical protein